MLQAAPVENVSTSTTLASSVNPSVFGQAITVTSQVTASSGTPTGVVLFSGSPYQFNPGFLTNGQTAEGASPAVGTYSITAAYQGITGFNPSTSSVLYQVVNKATTTTSLTSSSNPALIKQSVTFTATVNPQFIGFNPTGAVTFYSGQQPLGTATLSYGRATLTTSFAAGGTYSITAQYNGDSNFYGSTSSVLSQAILASTTTTLVSSLNPSPYGQAVTFTATVSSSAGAPPNGEIVTFYNGSAVLGTAPLSGGTAPLTTSSLPVGTFTIRASYSGDANFRASTSPGLRQVVNSTSKSMTSTAISSSLNPSIYGQAVTFTATVSSSAGAPPNGETITFKNGSAVLGTAPLSAGMASLTTSSLPAGIYTITASYAGDANFAASTSAGLRQVVNSTTKSATATTLASSLNPSIYGQSVTWTATVTTSGSVPPTGTVTFTWGDSIGRATLTSSPNPSSSGAAVTFTATITSPTVKPTGPVTFTAGKTVLGTAQLSNGKAELTTSTLSVGSTPVTATYYGDSNIAKSSASVTQTVQP